MSDEIGLVNLTVTSAPSAEIFLADSQLQLVASAVHQLQTRQLPGVYKLKVRQGRTSREELLLLEADTVMTLDAPEIASPVPIIGTRKSHEFHAAAAVECSRQVHWRMGAPTVPDTTIFVQSRYWTGATADASSGRSFAPPATGLSLRRFDDSEHVELASVAQPGSGPGWDPSAACTIGVTPGSYILSARTAAGTTVEQIIYAPPGWQTQVFVLRQPLQLERRRRVQEVAPDALSNEEIFSLAVTMGRGGYRESDQMHLSELARLALADERALVSSELQSVLNQKFANPMLGIFAAHLMLVAEERRGARTRRGSRQEAPPIETPAFDPALFDHVVRVLRDLVGSDHPDVEALSLRLSQPSERHAAPMTTPPMLRRSWSLLVAGTEETPDLVPVELWKRVAPTAPSRPFLIWFAEEKGQELQSELADEYRTRLMPSRRPEANLQRSIGVAGPPTPTSSDAETRRIARELDVPASAVRWLTDTK